MVGKVYLAGDEIVSPTCYCAVFVVDVMRVTSDPRGAVAAQ